MLVETLNTVSIPAKPDTVFLRPHPGQWICLLRANERLLAGRPGRAEAAAYVLDAARRYTTDLLGETDRNDNSTLIVTGHQACWTHCGILAKDIVAWKLARAVGGTAVHLVVDHDTAETSLPVPVRNGAGRLRFEKAGFERPRHLSAECCAAPDGQQLARFLDRLGAVEDSLCAEVWSKRREQILDRPFHDVAETITFLQALLKAAAGIRTLYLPVSVLCGGSVFLEFVARILADSKGFAQSYNRAVAAGTGGQTPHTGRRPRSLLVDENKGAFELPFWLLRRDTGLHRMWVRPTDGGIDVGTKDGPLGSIDAADVATTALQLKGLLERTGWRLRPRAVTLTLFARSMFAGLFVHGVGGTQYEYVTDAMLEDFFGIKGTAYGVATANVSFIDGRPGKPETPSANDLRAELRRLRYNPERFIAPAARQAEPVRSLLETKQRLIAAANDRSHSKEQRQSAWRDIRRVNEGLLHFVADAQQSLQRQLDAPEQADAVSATAQQRELFFGLFPRRTIEQMAECVSFERASPAEQQPMSTAR